MFFRFKMRLICAIFLIFITFCKGGQGKVEAYYEDAKEILPNRIYYWKNWCFCLSAINYLHIWSEAAALQFWKESSGWVFFVINGEKWKTTYNVEPVEDSDPNYHSSEIKTMIHSATRTQPILSHAGSTKLIFGNWYLNSYKEGEMTIRFSKAQLVITFQENFSGFTVENECNQMQKTFSAKTFLGAEFSTSWIRRQKPNQTELQPNFTSCCMLNRNNSDNGWTEFQCHTNARLHNISYAWTINRFDLHRPADNLERKIRSPLFWSATYNRIKWYLQITPGNKTSNKIALYLNRCTNSTETETLAHLSIHFLDSKGNLLHRLTQHWFKTFNAETGWGYGDIPINQVVSSDNTLNVVCKIAVCEFTTNTIHVNRTDTFINSENNRSRNTVHSSLKNPDDLDIILVLAKTGKEYPANKSVLAASSPVFATMFNISCTEKGEIINRFNITDIDSEQVMDELLKYIHTSKCENIENLAHDLLVAAHKYKLDNLTELCVQKLTNNLTVENVVETLNLADKHNVDKLKSKTIRFIATNYAQMSNNSDWKQIMKTKNGEFFHEVFQLLSNKLSNQV